MNHGNYHIKPFVLPFAAAGGAFTPPRYSIIISWLSVIYEQFQYFIDFSTARKAFVCPVLLCADGGLCHFTWQMTEKRDVTLLK